MEKITKEQKIYKIDDFNDLKLDDSKYPSDNTVNRCKTELCDYINEHNLKYIPDTSFLEFRGGYDWEAILNVNVYATFEGESEPTIITMTWEEYGNSMISFNIDEKYDDPSVFNNTPQFQPACIYQMGKWYRLDGENANELDIAKKYNPKHAIEIIEKQRINYKKITHDKMNQIKQLNFAIQDLTNQNQKLKYEISDLKIWYWLSAVMVGLYAYSRMFD
jgi:hypothetical protein